MNINDLKKIKCYLVAYDNTMAVNCVIRDLQNGIPINKAFGKIHFWGYAPLFIRILQWHKLESTDEIELKELNRLIKLLQIVELSNLLNIKFQRRKKERYERTQTQRIRQSNPPTPLRAVSHG